MDPPDQIAEVRVAVRLFEVRSRDAVEEFCRRSYPRLMRTLTVSTGDELVAHEVTQEALARAWQRWDRVSTLDSPEAWCYRVALNLATSHFRRRAAERRAHRRLEGLRPVGVEVIGDDSGLREALARLPQGQRTVLALRFLADLSVDETAVAMQIAAGTVKSTTSRALVALRELLEREQVHEHD